MPDACVRAICTRTLPGTYFDTLLLDVLAVLVPATRNYRGVRVGARIVPRREAYSPIPVIPVDASACMGYQIVLEQRTMCKLRSHV